jgi:Fur family ferric uptake transcriptional regulator
MVQTPQYTASALKAELNAKGWRMTPQRQTILKMFQELPEGNHLNAEELFERLQAEDANTGISLSTVYRTLKLMARMGILRELELAEGHKHYEINQPYPHHHHHLVCVRCYRTIEFKSNPILTIGAKAAQERGFKLLDCQLTIHAVCPECQRSIVQ